MASIAFLTMDSLDGFVSYDGLVRDILRERSFRVDEISWRAADAHWDQYDLVVIRSPWDYQQACDEFLGVLARIEASTARLENSLDIVRWNIQKTYLRQLEESGVTIVPTHWVENPSMSQLQQLFEQLGSDDIVIKPVVGANADDAFWLKPDSSVEIFRAAEYTFRNRLMLAQPFVKSVTTSGEISLIFFAGEYSHSVLKTPKPGDFRVQEEHGGQIQSFEPDREIIEFAIRTLRNVPGDTLYARVDVVLLSNNQPALMEVELIEPSLYLTYNRQSPKRFADVIDDLL